MNYTELKANIQDVCENEFTDAQLALFTEQAEQKIYSSVQLPALRKNAALTFTVGNEFVSVPSDFLYSFSLAVVDGSGETHYLLNKDVNFIREAYPVNNVASRGLPRYYAYYNDAQLIFGPTPNSAYTISLAYGYYPESIVTAGTTWLGDEFDSALLNGALVEAIRFMKGEQDMIALYQGMFTQSLQLLKQLGEGKLRQDMYRSGQTRVPVK